MRMEEGMSQLDLEDEVQDDLKRATGEFTKDADDSNKLNHILQVIGLPLHPRLNTPMKLSAEDDNQLTEVEGDGGCLRSGKWGS
ncbi:coatomer subunit beta-1 [Trifolium pratense]|uniref:Coatomer subunit beta-1 n=1 Tax=Trifolium pratense TaxID=57577 RepID=A0A2K3PBL9_TRIPR|nr:coatomer subunit beta-1 [Trifolium pratense]